LWMPVFVRDELREKRDVIVNYPRLEDL